LLGTFLNVVRLDISPEHEKEMDDFFHEEHFTSLLAVPGVLSGRRFRLVQGEGPRHMMVWEIERPEVIESEAYRQAAFTPRREKVAVHYTSRLQTTYEEITGFRYTQYDGMKSSYVLVDRTDILPQVEDEFNDWSAREYVPLLLTLPGWMAARRFRRLKGSDPKYIAIYEIQDPSAIEGGGYERIHRTDSYLRFRSQCKNISIVLYEQLYGLTRY
jgi:hypothetical protein